jgi:ribosomal protein L40E
MEAYQKICHRCSSLLPEDALFCVQCGSPQLVLTETDAQRVADERAATPDGSAPMPRVSAAGRIRWRPVIHIVVGLSLIMMAVAGMAAVAPGLGFLGTLLILLGPMLALRLYQRRVPGAPMGAGIGARIGAMLGGLMAFVVTAVNVAFLLVYRYVLHHSAEMDEKMSALMQQSMTRAIAAYPQLYPNPAQAMQNVQFYMTPDGHATFALIIVTSLTAAVVAYTSLAGAALGWLRAATVRAQSKS